MITILLFVYYFAIMISGDDVAVNAESVTAD